MISWATNTLVAVSLLIVVVLLLRRPVGQAFGARAAYALWAAPLIRAVAPPLPAEAMPLPTTGLMGSAQYELIVTNSGDAGPWSLTDVLVALWLVGAAIFLAVHLWRHHRFVAAALREGRALDVAGVPYDVVASEAVDGPVATGLVHPLILVPADFTERFDAHQQQLALLHEQLHHRRGDIWACAAALVVTALLWFNPIAHIALGAFRRDMESACDARLLTQSGRASAPAYAETILRCSVRPVPRSLCALTTIDELKGRLMMLKSNHGFARRAAGLLVAGAISFGGLALAVPAVAHEEPGKEQVFEKKVIIRGQGDKDVLRHGEAGDLERIGAKCPGEKFEVGSEGGGTGKIKEVHFILCTDKGQSLLPALEKAVTEIEKDRLELDSGKAEILSKLRAKIAELRARG